MSRIANSELRFSDEQAMIMKAAREFCKGKSPIPSVRELLNTDTGFDSKLWSEITELGWMGIAIPEEFGGIGMDIGSLVPISENMGRHMFSTPFFSANLVAQALLRAGKETQKKLWLPRLADGAFAALALLDNEDWGAENIECIATESGGQLVLTGIKSFVLDAGVAELFIVSLDYQGTPALAIVNREQLPEDAISRQTLIDETKRAFKVDFSGVVVEKTALLDLTKSESALRDLKLIGALLTAAEATGSAAAALDNMVQYLKIRKQFGKPIGSYQALKYPAVGALIQMEHARNLIYHAATIVGGDSFDADMEIACRMAKVQAVEALIFVGDRNVQFHGGMGFTYDCDAQLFIRRAQWSQQQFGDAHHHRKRLASLLLD